MKRWVVIVAVLAVVLFRAPEASATVTFAGSSGSLAASASFTISGTTLTVLLTNTGSAYNNMGPAAVLSGLYFNLGSSTFTRTSATIAAGSIVQSNKCSIGPCNSGTTNVGGEWSYYGNGGNDIESGISGVQQHVISSSGYIDGNANSGNFNGSNLDGPNALNGIEFGIVPSNFSSGQGNGGLDSEPLIKGAATFVLKIPAGLTEAMISNVKFAYGTSDSEARFSGSKTTNTTGGTTGSVPEPTSLALFGAGLAFAAYRLRSRSA